MINQHSNLFEYVDNFAKSLDVLSIPIIESTLDHVPEITIAIPTYKRADLLKEAIDSAINQTGYNNYDIVVVDNNPERGCETEKLMKSYNNPKISYFKNSENLGMAGNWNRLYTLAKGKWVTMLHDDDYLLKDYLIEVKKFLIEKFDVINISYLKWDESKYKEPLVPIKKKVSYIYKYSPFDFLFGFKVGAPLGMIIKKEFMKKIGGFSDSFYPSMDYAFMVRATNYGHVIKLLSKELAVYRYRVNETLNYENMEKFIKMNFFIKNCVIQNLSKKTYIEKYFNRYFNSYSNKYIDSATIRFGFDTSILIEKYKSLDKLKESHFALINTFYSIYYILKKLYYSISYYILYGGKNIIHRR